MEAFIGNPKQVQGSETPAPGGPPGIGNITAEPPALGPTAVKERLKQLFEARDVIFTELQDAEKQLNDILEMETDLIGNLAVLNEECCKIAERISSKGEGVREVPANGQPPTPKIQPGDWELGAARELYRKIRGDSGLSPDLQEELALTIRNSVAKENIKIQEKHLKAKASTVSCVEDLLRMRISDAARKRVDVLRSELKQFDSLLENLKSTFLEEKLGEGIVVDQNKVKVCIRPKSRLERIMDGIESAVQMVERMNAVKIWMKVDLISSMADLARSHVGPSCLSRLYPTGYGTPTRTIGKD